MGMDQARSIQGGLELLNLLRRLSISSIRELIANRDKDNSELCVWNQKYGGTLKFVNSELNN